MFFAVLVFLSTSLSCLAPAAAVGSQASSPSASASLDVLSAGGTAAVPMGVSAPGAPSAELHDVDAILPQSGAGNAGGLLRREVRREMGSTPEDSSSSILSDAVDGVIDAASAKNAPLALQQSEAPVSVNGSMDLDFETLLQGNATSFIEAMHGAGRISSVEREVMMEYLGSLEGDQALPSAAQLIHKAADWLAGATEIVPEDYPFACRCSHEGKCLLDTKFNTSCMVRPGQGADGSTPGQTGAVTPITPAPTSETESTEGEGEGEKESLLQQVYSYFRPA